MGRDCKVDKRRKEEKMNWLEWNGKKLEEKAKLQALSVLHEELRENALVHLLTHEILKAHRQLSGENKREGSQAAQRVWWSLNSGRR